MIGPWECCFFSLSLLLLVKKRERREKDIGAELTNPSMSSHVVMISTCSPPLLNRYSKNEQSVENNRINSSNSNSCNKMLIIIIDLLKFFFWGGGRVKQKLSISL